MIAKCTCYITRTAASDRQMPRKWPGRSAKSCPPMWPSTSQRPVVHTAQVQRIASRETPALGIHFVRTCSTKDTGATLHQDRFFKKLQDSPASFHALFARVEYFILKKKKKTHDEWAFLAGHRASLLCPGLLIYFLNRKPLYLTTRTLYETHEWARSFLD